MNWPVVKLPDAFWFQEGPGIRNWQFTNSGVKLLNVGNIMLDGSIDLSRTERHVSVEEFQSKYPHFAIDNGDLVMASSGISFDTDGYLRTKVAFIREHDLPLCLNTSTIRFKSMDDISDLNYLRHWLNGPEFRRQVSRLVTGSAQLNFGPSHLKAMDITLPPLPEQKRIAAILDQADALRRLRAQALEKVNTLGQAIFQEMFGDTGTKTKMPLEAVMTVKSSLDDPQKEANRFLPHVGPEHIVSGSGQISWDSVKSCAEDGVISGKYHFRALDIIYSKIRPYLNKVAIADRRGMCSADMYAIQAKREMMSTEFLQFILGGADFLRYAETVSNRANIPKMNRGQLLAYECSVPSLNDQAEFARRIKMLTDIRQVGAQASSSASALFSSLQHRAFRGEL